MCVVHTVLISRTITVKGVGGVTRMRTQARGHGSSLCEIGAKLHFQIKFVIKSFMILKLHVGSIRLMVYDAIRPIQKGGDRTEGWKGRRVDKVAERAYACFMGANYNFSCDWNSPASVGCCTVIVITAATIKWEEQC